MPPSTTFAPLPPADTIFRSTHAATLSVEPASHHDDLPTQLDSAKPNDDATPPTIPDDKDAGCLPAGTKLRQFVIERVLGEGGFGVVYSAYDLALGRRVAIKEYMPAALAVRRADFSVQVRSSSEKQAAFAIGLKSFVNEARLLAQLDHPALAKVFQFWTERGTAYFVMPYYTSPTLAAWLRERRGTVIDEVWLRRYFLAALDALSFLHGKSCLHRDLSPQNLLVVNDADPLLLDFGAARKVIGAQSATLTAILKPGYAPLEQYDGNTLKQGPWTDLYALSAVMYQVMTGTPPPAAVERVMQASARPRGETTTNVSALHAALEKTPYSPALKAAVEMGLALHPRHRPQHAEDLAALIRLSENTVPTRVAPATMSTPRPATLNYERIPTLNVALQVNTTATPTSARRTGALMASAVGVIAISALSLALWPTGPTLQSIVAARAEREPSAKQIGSALNEPVRAGFSESSTTAAARIEPSALLGAVAVVEAPSAALIERAIEPRVPPARKSAAKNPAASSPRADKQATDRTAHAAASDLPPALPPLLHASNTPTQEAAPRPTTLVTTDAASTLERSALERSATERPAPEPLHAIVRPEPQFPTEALRDGVLKGRVTVSFIVNADGSVTAVRIAEAVPPRVFDRAVRSAIAQWRFAPLAAATPATVEFAFDVAR